MLINPSQARPMPTAISEEPKGFGGSNEGPTEYAEEDGNRVECEVCGRKFNEDRLEKHMKICSKVTNKKRKVFNIKEKWKPDNVDGDDGYSYKPPPPKKQPVGKKAPNNPENQAVGGAGSKKSKWK